MVDRVLKGEDPGKMPFERYRKVTIGINMRVAEEMGLQIPDEVTSCPSFDMRSNRLLPSNPVLPVTNVFMASLL